MSVETYQFRVAGVDIDTGEDVSVVIEAATKAAAEVKAEQLNIDTTHIVRLKRHDDPSADEHTQFTQDAAEARSTTPTDKLIEEVVPPEEPKIKLTSAPPPPPKPQPQPEPQQAPPVLAAISRPAYSAPSVKLGGNRPTGTSALLFILAVLCGIAGGAYYVLVQQPNSASADPAHLLTGDALFDTAPEEAATTERPSQPRLNNTNAFHQRGGRSTATAPPTQPPAITPREPEPAPRATLELQSVVVSHEGRFALLNGKLTPVGETIAGYTLVSVGDDWVVLEHNGEQSVLRIVPNDDAAE